MGKLEVEISPEHGLNPIIPVCFFCGDKKNEIVLLGRVRAKGQPDSDIEAPMYGVVDYEPCNACAEKFAQGILMMEASTEPTETNQPPYEEGVYPTGRYLVITEHGIASIIADDEMLDEVMEKRKCFVEPDLFEMICSAFTSSE